MSVLTAVDCTLTTGSGNGDGLDGNSTLYVILHPTTSPNRYAEISFNGRDGTGGHTNPGDVKTFSLILSTTTLTKAEIDGLFSIDIIIHAVGRDEYKGTLKAIFRFDDGTIDGSFDYDFTIGTFGESNQTGKPVQFLP